MGFSIGIEGIDRIGKGTQINKLMTDPEFKKLNLVYTREPGGDEVAEAIRDLVKDKSYFNKMSPKTEALLFAASRAQHTQEKLIPLTEEDNVIICDRYVHSSLVYQGMRQGINDRDIIEMNNIAMSGFNLDYCIIFYMSSNEKLIERFKLLEGSEDRFELEGAEFFTKVNHRYRGFPFNEIFTDTKHFYINCDGTIDEIYNNLKYVFKHILLLEGLKNNTLKYRVSYSDDLTHHFCYESKFVKKTRWKRVTAKTKGPNKLSLYISHKDMIGFRSSYSMETIDRIELYNKGVILKDIYFGYSEKISSEGANKDLDLEINIDQTIFRGM